MTQSVLPLILASGSPRRRELLDLMGLAYTVETPDVDESFSGKPAETVMEISRRKAVAVAGRHDEAIIIAADTQAAYTGTRERNASKFSRELASCLYWCDCYQYAQRTHPSQR